MTYERILSQHLTKSKGFWRSMVEYAWPEEEPEFVYIRVPSTRVRLSEPARDQMKSWMMNIEFDTNPMADPSVQCIQCFRTTIGAACMVIIYLVTGILVLVILGYAYPWLAGAWRGASTTRVQRVQTPEVAVAAIDYEPVKVARPTARRTIRTQDVLPQNLVVNSTPRKTSGNSVSRLTNALNEASAQNIVLDDA